MKINTVRKKCGVVPADSFVIPKREMERIVNFEEDDPFDFLGPHLISPKRGIVLHAFLPYARRAWLQRLPPARAKKPMQRIHPNGVFQALFPERSEKLNYKLIAQDFEGHVSEIEDPYAFPPQITDEDIHLFTQGNHFKSYEKFGARPMSIGKTAGVHFSVWALHAKAVSVVGDFNGWNPVSHPMQRVHFSGIWALFIPGRKEGDLYKFAIKSWGDPQIYLKTDPYGFRTELRPKTASVVTSLKNYSWHDPHWMSSRAKKNALDAPLSIYEVHLGSWKKNDAGGFLNYRELAHEIVAHVKKMGYTHVELMPVAEHPLDESWGYQVVSYFAPTSRYGTPQDFMYFIDTCHQHDIGVILDWVPAHFPKDAHGLYRFDGTEIFAYENWKKAEHRDWGTLVFDYGKNEVRNFLISNALFWLDYYHADGLRVDAVASMLYLDYSRKDGEWEPNPFGGRENLEAIDFLKKFNEVVHSYFPGVLTIAEESTAWPRVSRPTYLHGLGFSLKWNMGWMHDTLDYFSRDPVYRKYHHDRLTFSLLYAFSENFVLPISHDEVVYGKRSLFEKMPGDDWQKFANLRLFLGYLFSHPGKKLLFMGSDIAQREEWNSQGSIGWHYLNDLPHKQLNLFVRDLNALYQKSKALHEVDFESPGFDWIDFSDREASVISFIRRGKREEEKLVIACNMTPVPRWDYRIGVPESGFYQEILNSDAREYGGSGVGNFGGVFADEIPWHSRPASLRLQLPPLGCLYLKRERSDGKQ